MLSNRFLFISIVATLGAHLATLHAPFLPTVFRTEPLSYEHWRLILLVAAAVIAGGELDKWWERRRHRPLGLNVRLCTSSPRIAQATNLARRGGGDKHRHAKPRGELTGGNPEQQERTGQEKDRVNCRYPGVV